MLVDHKPLLGIFNDRDLGSITNPRLQNLKESTLGWNFTIKYNPGKWHKGPDAVSRNPSVSNMLIDNAAPVLQCISTSECSDVDNFNLDAREEQIQSISILNLYSVSSGTISLDEIRNEGHSDPAYTALIVLIEEGFPSTRPNTDPALREFWEVRERLTTQDGIVYLDKRLTP